MIAPIAEPEDGARNAAGSRPQQETKFDQSEFRTRLTDEYKILQDKMDKIGAFRFTIKGWSVTAVIAASAAGSAVKNMPIAAVLTISVGLAVMLFFFLFFEFKQVRLSRIFGERARKLEVSFHLMDADARLPSGSRIAVPYTAHEIVRSLGEQKLFGARAEIAGRGRNRFPRRLLNWWRIVSQSDLCFYITLIVLAFVLPLAPRYAMRTPSTKPAASQVDVANTRQGANLSPPNDKSGAPIRKEP